MIEIIKRKANFTITMIALIFAGVIPTLGILMDDTWYKWTYILVSHIIGLVIFLFIHKWYLINSESDRVVDNHTFCKIF